MKTKLFTVLILLAGAGFLAYKTTSKKPDGGISHQGEQRTAKTYRNEQYGFEVQYPKDFELETTGLDSQFSADQGETLIAVWSLSEPEKKYPNTDLWHAYFLISTADQQPVDCGKIPGRETDNPTPETINSTNFSRREFGDAAAGTQHFGRKYSAINGGKCVVLTETVITSGYGAVEGLTQVDSDAVLAKLHEITKTFKFILIHLGSPLLC